MLTLLLRLRTKTGKYNYMLRAVLAPSSETQKSKNPKIQNFARGPKLLVFWVFLKFFGFPTEIKTNTIFFGFPTEIHKNNARFFWFFTRNPAEKTKKTLCFLVFNKKSKTKKAMVSLRRNSKNKKALGKQKNKSFEPLRKFLDFGFFGFRRSTTKPKIQTSKNPKPL